MSGNEDLRPVVGHAAGGFDIGLVRLLADVQNLPEGIAHYFALTFDHARERMRDLHTLLPNLEFPFDSSIYLGLRLLQQGCERHVRGIPLL